MTSSNLVQVSHGHNHHLLHPRLSHHRDGEASMHGCPFTEPVLCRECVLLNAFHGSSCLGSFPNSVRCDFDLQQLLTDLIIPESIAPLAASLAPGSPPSSLVSPVGPRSAGAGPDQIPPDGAVRGPNKLVSGLQTLVGTRQTASCFCPTCKIPARVV